MKIGDYARTINGKIWIIKSQQAISGHKKDIIKSSPNIIDLIEVGDYVNGVRVDEIIYIGHGKLEDLEIAFRYKYYFEKDVVYTLKEQDIKTIVTKEQFENMEYRIGE